MTATTTSISEWEQWQRKIQKCLLACFSFPYPFSLFFLCAFQQLTRTYALLVSLMNFNVCGCVNFFSLILYFYFPSFRIVCSIRSVCYEVLLGRSTQVTNAARLYVFESSMLCLWNPSALPLCHPVAVYLQLSTHPYVIKCNHFVCYTSFL